MSDITDHPGRELLMRENMKGRKVFTADEVAQIKQLLREKARADATTQKTIRGKIRKLGFYIEDFALDWSGFRAVDFQRLIDNGEITVEG